MRVRLLKPHKGRKAGAEFVPAWDAEARRLIADGIAVPAGTVDSAEAVTGSAAPVTKPPAANTVKPKPAKAPKPAKK